MAYVPGASVGFLHGAPRFTSGMNTIPGAFFELKITDPGVIEYGTDIAIFAGILAGIGLLLAFILLATSCCACCRCCCFSSCLCCREGDSRSMLFVALIVACLGFVGVGFGAVGPVTVVTQQIEETTLAMQGLGNHLGDVVGRVDTALLRAEEFANATSQLVTALEQANATSGGSFAGDLQQARAADALARASSASLNASTTVVARVAGPLSTFDNVLDHPEVRDYTSLVPLAATIAFGCAVVVLFITLLPHWLCKWPHRTASSLGLLLVVILFIMAAALLALCMLLSDACQDPTLAAQTAAHVYETGTPAVLTDSVAFYTECRPNFINDPEGVNMTNTPVQRARDAKAALDQADPAVQTIHEAMLAGEYTAYGDSQATADAFVTAFSRVFQAVLDVQGRLECGAVQPLYNRLVTGVCAGFLEQGVFVLWAMQTGAAVVLVVVMLLNLVPCLQHPGEKAPGELESPAVMPVGSQSALHGGTYVGGKGGFAEDEDEYGMSAGQDPSQAAYGRRG